MKLLKYIGIISLFLTLGSCSEDILIEKPLDFLGPENAFNGSNDIESAINRNYFEVRRFFEGKYWTTGYLHSGTDAAMWARDKTSLLGNYAGLTPASGIALSYWSRLYSIVSNTNLVLSRIDAVDYPSDAEKNAHIAETRFFRGFAYRCLVHLYGGVPIVDTEITAPKNDFVRATKEETLAFAIADLEFAADNLPTPADVSVDGKVSNAAALHILSELYITVGDLDKAIAAASTVIDDSGLALMTSRFGSKSTEDGDPFWDLFQLGNQNRSSGNTEGIFVAQVEINTLGGGAQANENYNQNTLSYERNYGPLFWFLQDPDGVNSFIGATTYNGGRPVGFIRPTPHLSHGVWGNGNFDVDLRNHNRNLQRDWVNDNPASAYFGQKLSDYPESWFTGLTEQDTLRDFYPYFTKVTTKGDHPSNVIADPSTGVMTGLGGQTYSDWYIMRLAETYLLRAEAYLGQGNLTAAANDINMIRNRANAIPVDPSDVDIDYILDERLRELNWEEPRRMTLSRLGLLDERTQAYNPFSSSTVKEMHNLFPIPFREIEINTEAVLDQNPGYTN